MGAVYSMTLSGISCRKYAYLFKAGHHEFMDPHATRTTGNEQWGKNKALGLFPCDLSLPSNVTGIAYNRRRNISASGGDLTWQAGPESEEELLDKAGAAKDKSLEKGGAAGEKAVSGLDSKGKTENAVSLSMEEVKPDREYNLAYNKGRTVFGKAPVSDLAGYDPVYDGYRREDRPLGRPFSELILYLMHIRGFTKHKSSGVKWPGTFEGAVEKLPYLLDLGINAIELLPPYDFNEVMHEEHFSSARDAESSPEKAAFSKKKRINYWGFTGGNYFTPKNSYSADGNGPRSFQRMVRAFHNEGIEVLVDFFFEEGTGAGFILNCLHYWVFQYGVDGFRILGTNLPEQALLTDPYLANIKLLMDRVPQCVFEGPAPSLQASGGNLAMDESATLLKQVGFLNTPFMYDNRKFLKSDEDMLTAFTGHMLENPERYSVVNFMTSYYGFNMCDMVSYDQKHNEANGEDNADGNNYNYSWNCGVEGVSRRKNINLLRNKQVRNAFCYLLLSQGTPEILAGDEFLHSQKGNNNAYCQDNSVTWLNWDNLRKHEEIHDFVRSLIAFRKAHPVFHSREAKRLTDYKSCGYPDLSFHGEQAWAPRFDNFFRHIGLLYAGAYEKREDGTLDDDFYVAFNMHWQAHQFALPNPPAGKQWVQVFSTDQGFIEETGFLEGNRFPVESRSVRVLMTKELPKSPKRKATGRKKAVKG
ncbi:MAG: hypothetical protein K5989_12165, partial [Lachnospiraceae bacterium]|nr:hypothetical protein [Lachnospiraceae bacterium]